ncbi:MAG: enoyl-CoA hydratase-related protein [Proteobacteria bacterium]|nr:enoyl-CoA hydratase-related protein [Pseudomonadota bacterium]
MDYQQIAVERRGAVELITLQRPEKLNAWTPRMSEEQAHAIANANDDPAVGAIVMTGAGRGFCAGADMEETFQKRIDGVDPGNDTAGGEGGMPADVHWVDLVRASKPIVAAVNGAAVGVGMTMVLPCDVIVAGTKARFGMFFIKVGLVPELASTHYLVQRMGFGRASEMCLSGRLYGAEEAAECGLVDHLVEDDQLLERALAIAADFAANPSPQLRMIKELLTANGTDSDLAAVQHRESELLRACWKTPEHKEAVQAFIEKRPPRFR